jgi:streptomycin 6-kinase
LNQLPKKFVNNIVFHYKEKGKAWLEQLDELISYCEDRWCLKTENHYDLSYNYVAPAITNDGKEVVVKLSFPNIEVEHEQEALKVFNGDGIARLIDCDLARGITIIEKVSPGYMLSTVKDDVEATKIAANVIKHIWRDAPRDSSIPTLKDRENGMKHILAKHPNGHGPISKDILQRAVHMYEHMNATTKKAYLLHGDFHHYNVLKGENGWIAIDPKGLIGEKECDLIQYLLNCLPKENAAEVIEQRINIFVDELKLDKSRLIKWGYCHTVLATCWGIDDDGNYDENGTFLNYIDVFDKLLER